MSHINEALKKAQKEKDSLYHRYKKLISGPAGTDEGSKKPKRKTLIILLSVFSAAVIAYAVTSHTGWHPEKKSPPQRRVIRQKIITPVQEKAPESTITRDHRTPPASSVSPTRAGTASAAQKPGEENGKPTTTQETPRHSAPPSRDTGTVKKRDPLPEARQKNLPVAVSSPAEKKPATLPDVRAGKPTIQAQPVTTDNLYQQALLFHRENNLARAELLYRKILRSDPKFVTALNNLGVIYMVQKKDKQAIRAFSKAIKAKDDYIDPYYNLACLYSKSGDLPLSIHYLKKAIALKNDVKIWAKNDKDLTRLRKSKEFRMLTAGGSAAEEGTYEIYIVKKNEWIFDIVRKKYGAADKDVHGILKMMRQLNPELKNWDAIYPGQKLLIPTKKK